MREAARKKSIEIVDGVEIEVNSEHPVKHHWIVNLIIVIYLINDSDGELSRKSGTIIIYRFLYIK